MTLANFLKLLLGAALSALFLWGMWRLNEPHGALGLVFGMPIIAVCVMPLLELVLGFPRAAQRLAMRKYDGRYYAFRGRYVDIHIEPDATCWVSTAHVRKIIAALPGDAVLARLQPGLVKETGEPRAWRITPPALGAVLAKATDAETTKFLQWLDDDAVQPARRRRERGMAMP